MPKRYCVGFNYLLNHDLRGSCVGSYMHSVMRIGKMVNAKVRTDDLRDLDTELGGWNLASLRK